jgi:hypothetical protein
MEAQAIHVPSIRRATGNRAWIIVLLGVLALAASCRGAATVTGMVQNITANWHTNSRVVFSNMNTPLINGNALVTSHPRYSMISASGWVSNRLVWGTNRVWVSDNPRDMVTIVVPDDNGTYDLWALRTNSLMMNSNAPNFVRGVAQGTNIITVTNASGVVTVHGTAVASGGSATNAVSTIKTNGTTVLTGVQTLIFTNGNNTTVTATGSGSTAIVAINSTLYGIQDDDTGATITSDDD